MKTKFHGSFDAYKSAYRPRVLLANGVTLAFNSNIERLLALS
jgi:hypothetical protein